MILYVALLFFVLTPSILVSLPPKGNKFTVAAVHAIIFALIFHFSHKLVHGVLSGFEGFQEGYSCSANKPHCPDKMWCNYQAKTCTNKKP
jgi:hypothetical protein